MTGMESYPSQFITNYSNKLRDCRGYIRLINVHYVDDPG